MEHSGAAAPIAPLSDRRGELHFGSFSTAALRAGLDATTPLEGAPLLQACKRLIDFMGAAVALLVLSPLLVMLTCVLAAETRGHPIFIQQRVGRYGSSFRLLKFRTMSLASDVSLEDQLQRNDQLAQEWAAFRKLREDPRVTRIGRLLRKYSLDEIPQFLNVLVGHMSLVGPRPIVADEVTRFGDQMPAVLSVRPGLTGLWSVSGRNELGYAERVQLEYRYVTRWTLGLDLSILLRTIPTVIRGRGAY